MRCCIFVEFADPNSSNVWGGCKYYIIWRHPLHRCRPRAPSSAALAGEGERERGWRGREREPDGGCINGMVIKRGPPATVSLKLHLSFLVGSEWSSPLHDGRWTEANLTSACEIEISSTSISTSTRSNGIDNSTPVSCSGLGPLHTIIRDEAVTVRVLAVRPRYPSPSVSDTRISPQTAPTADTGTTNGTAPPAPSPAPVASSSTLPLLMTPADLWAELDVSNVRPHAHISASPSLLPAWRLLLPSLVTYTREEAQAPAPAPAPAAAAAAPAGERATQDQKGGKAGCNGGHKEVPEVRALEALYASLYSWNGRVRCGGDAGAAGAAVGPAPGASGLNSVPAAVVMKGVRSDCFPQ